MIKKFKLLATSISLLGVFVYAGCGGQQTTEPDVLGPDLNAQFSLRDVQAYSGFVGTRSLDLDLQFDRPLSSIELFCDDQSAGQAAADATNIDFDSSACADGIVQLSLKVIDSSQNEYMSAETLPVIVVNNGSSALISEGPEGSVIVPASYDGTQDVDATGHWGTPENTTRIIAVATWDLADPQHAWNLELTIGTGFCPHSGHAWGSAVNSTASPLVIDMSAAEINQATFDLGQSFMHLRPLDAMDHVGENQPYHIAVYLF